MSAFPKSCDFIILLPLQDPQGTSHSTPAKRCRLSTIKRPAYEPANNPPPQKRPLVEEEDEEEYLAISVSLNDEEEKLNLVSPLPTSKVF